LSDPQPLTMRIWFYAPFKPLGHINPSGDLVIATGLVDYLSRRGHGVQTASRLRARWIYWKPWQWLRAAVDGLRAIRRIRQKGGDLWLTYHSYYKAPDLLGPWAARQGGIPYVIFQGIYSTKRRRDPRTWAGFMLNRAALSKARQVFTNRRDDWVNLRRLLPDSRITYVTPGIYPEDFTFDPQARSTLRRDWAVDHNPVILTAAMFRPGVKSRGLEWVIRTCGRLYRRNKPFFLVIAGDGREGGRLRHLAETEIPGRFRFVGKIPREQLYQFYSAGDLFVFPGIRESLGMVFLEAQSCGLPVVAFENGGIPEVVQHGKTGLLVPLFDGDAFAGAVDSLLGDPVRRRRMGDAARQHVRVHHDLNRNYSAVEKKLVQIARESGGSAAARDIVPCRRAG